MFLPPIHTYLFPSLHLQARLIGWTQDPYTPYFLEHEARHLPRWLVTDRLTEVDNPQATSSRAPSTTTESSRTPPSWLASSLTSRPKSTSPPASAATSSWAYTKCSYHQQDPVPASHGDDNALITGLFFLGGSNDDKGNDDKGNEFQYGNIRVRLQTSNQGFVFGVGRGSISILRITLRFTIDFLDGKNEDFGLGRKKRAQTLKGMGMGFMGKRTRMIIGERGSRAKVAGQGIWMSNTYFHYR